MILYILGSASRTVNLGSSCRFIINKVWLVFLFLFFNYVFSSFYDCSSISCLSFSGTIQRVVFRIKIFICWYHDSLLSLTTKKKKLKWFSREASTSPIHSQHWGSSFWNLIVRDSDSPCWQTCLKVIHMPEWSQIHFVPGLMRNYWSLPGNLGVKTAELKVTDSISYYHSPEPA